MQEIVDEIKATEKVIIDIHKQAAAIVHNRRDIKEPLSFSEATEYDKLNSRCLELQRQLAHLKTKKRTLQDKQYKLNQIAHTQLKEGEQKIMVVMEKSYPKLLKIQDICLKASIKRNRAYEYMRGFQIAGIIVYVNKTPTNEGYVLSDDGIAYVRLKNKTQ